jgi:hypothetical protein
MTTTYLVQPDEADYFIQVFKKSFADRAVKVTVETLYETPEETNRRILKTVEAENSGRAPFKILTMQELAEMVQ